MGLLDCVSNSLTLAAPAPRALATGPEGAGRLAAPQ